MKFVAILLLSSLTIAMVTAFPDNDDKNRIVRSVPVPVFKLAPPASDSSSDPSESPDVVFNSIRRPRHLLSKLFQPTVVVQPVIVEPQLPRQFPAYSPQPYPTYNAPYPYFAQGKGSW
ncbi:uncharacterized protein LOC108108933 [Drosophila eugracilis]|uniref:uncharacterized protein LOC108108933 n=1 Tax=Drosophila eugracilis TaxID=29029 RepID=UPI0007E5C105|nr:uncharacterized protein LOC108108933 [Drosophila eugracilis]